MYVCNKLKGLLNELFHALSLFEKKKPSRLKKRFPNEGPFLIQKSLSGFINVFMRVFHDDDQ